MMIDITSPSFTIANVPARKRTECLEQLSTARDNGFITQNEFLEIACMQWYVECKIANLKK